jgi:hypothetical protein
MTGPVPIKVRPEPPEVAVMRRQVEGLVGQAQAHRITDDLTRGTAADIRGALKKAERVLDDSRTALVGPLNDHVRFINALFKPLTEDLLAAVRAIDSEILRDRREREAAVYAEARRLEAEAALKQKELEEAQAAAAEEARKTAEAAAKLAGMKEDEAAELGQLFADDMKAEPLPPVMHVAAPPSPARTVVSESGARTVTKRIWDFEILDIAALAKSYPQTVEVRRAEVLSIIRCLDQAGTSEGRLATAIPGVRAFRRDVVAG